MSNHEQVAILKRALHASTSVKAHTSFGQNTAFLSGYMLRTLPSFSELPLSQAFRSTLSETAMLSDGKFI